MEKNKLLIIINIAFTTILLIVFIFTMINMNKTIKTLTQTSEGKPTLEKSEIVPPEDIEIYEMKEDQLLKIYSEKDINDSHALSIKIALGLNTKDKDYKKIKEDLDKNSVKYSSAIVDYLVVKSYEEIERADSKIILQGEVLQLLREKYNTNVLAEVYFNRFYPQ